MKLKRSAASLRQFLFLCITFIATATAYADDISFTTSAPSAVIVGNQFRVTYTLNAKGEDMRVPPFEGLRVLAGPSTSTSRQMSFINGKTASTVTYSYTYVLMAEQEGTFTIPSATVKVKKKTYTTKPQTINVLKNSNQQNAAGGSSSGAAQKAVGVSKEDMFVRTDLSKTKVMQQEYLIATVKLYTRLDLRGFETVKFPSYQGFLSYDIEEDKQLVAEIENVNGRNYRVYQMKKSILYPQRSGEITIEPADLDCIIRVRNNRRAQSFFDDFFDTYQDVRKKVSSKQRKVKVEAFSGSKPINFSGLSGDLSMVASVDVNELKTNEPVTLTVKISGNGNLKLVKTPNIEWPADFETYDAQVTNNINNTASGVSGSRTFEFLAIPRYAGEFTIPSYAFSYYDLNTRSFKTLRTQEIKLKVNKGDDDDSETVVTTFANKENVKFVGKDIRHIETGDLALKKAGTYFYGSKLYWILLGSPFILFLLTLVIYQKQLKDRRNVAKMRNKKANPIARKRLKLASKEMNAGNKEAFYDEILKGLWAYISNKLSIDISDLHKDNISQHLTNRSVDSELVDELIKLLDECEFARFAPSASSSNLENIYKQAAKMISRLENQIK